MVAGRSGAGIIPIVTLSICKLPFNKINNKRSYYYYPVLCNTNLGRDEGTGPPSRIVTFLRSEEHTSELQSRGHLVCRRLLEKKTPAARISTANWPGISQD